MLDGSRSSVFGQEGRVDVEFAVVIKDGEQTFGKDGSEGSGDEEGGGRGGEEGFGGLREGSERG